MTQHNQTPAIELDGVSKVFGGLKALSDISLTVQAGTIAALIGPNGSGKSTTINVVSGVYRADGGSISSFGRDITTAHSEYVARQGVIRTFQTPRLFSSESAIENALAGAHLYAKTNLASQATGLARRSARERGLRLRALELLELVGLADDAESPAGSLSTGAQKLLDLVRALMARPRVLLLDEPAAGLNDKETHELGVIMAAMRAADITVVFVEHNMGLVLSVADSIHVFHEGHMEFSGDTAAFRGNARVNEIFLGKGAS